MTFGREIDRKAAFAMMDYAAANGVTHFDTAAAYGGGASEKMVGEWIKASGARERIVLSTKLLPPYTARSLAESLAASLGRLQLPFVDLLYLHRWDDSLSDPRVLAALDALVRRGQARAVGASNFTCTQLERALAAQISSGLTAFTALQNVHNFALRSFDGPTRALCASRRMATIGYSPLGAGYLTGKYMTGVPAGTRFAIIPGHQTIYFTPESRARLARLQAVSNAHGFESAQLALAWATHQPGVDTVLVGGRTPEHLAAALRGRDLNIPEILAELEPADD